MPFVSETRLKMWQRLKPKLKVAVLCLAIAVAWGILTLPIVFYHIPTDNSGPSDVDCSLIAKSNDTCSSAVTYEGEVCREYLEGFQSRCLPGRVGSSDIHIAPQVDQDRIEMVLNPLLTDSTQLQFLGATPECENIIRPLFCVSAFRLCDGDGGLHDLSCGTCVSIRDGVCAMFWTMTTELEQSLPPELAASFPSLPVCESLPDPTGTCTATSGSGELDSSTSVEGDGSFQAARNCSSIQCSEGFYCTAETTSNFTVNICRPRCDTWMQESDTTQAALDAIIIIAGVIGLTSGTIALIITGIRWRKLFTFPSVLSVYLNISLMVFAFLNLVSYVDKPALYCSSTDLQESVDDPSPFCTFSGAMFHYIVLQSAIIWFIHVAALFYIINFPFHARNLQKSMKFKFVHIITVLIILILPVVAVIAIVGTGGFVFPEFPPQLCIGEDPDAVFYSFILPIDILSLVGTTLLLLLFYNIHTKHGLFRVKESKSSFKISTAEKKILISFCFYLVMGAVGLMAYTLLQRDRDNFESELTRYFICEAPGIDPNNPMPCDRDAYREFSYPELIAVAYVLYELFPLFNLIYVVDFTELKHLCMHGRTAPSYSSGRPTASSTDL